MRPESFGGVRFDLGSLLQGRMWYLIPMMDYISPIIGHRGFRCEDFGVRFDIVLCMSRFNHVLSGDTLRQDAISSFLCCYSAWFRFFIFDTVSLSLIYHRSDKGK